MGKHIAKAISEIRRRLDEIEKELAKIPQTSGSFDGISPKWFDLNDFPKDVRVRKTLIRVAGLVHEGFTDEQIRKSKIVGRKTKVIAVLDLFLEKWRASSR